MRASCLATLGVLLTVAIFEPAPLAAEYPFDSMPAMPPLAGPSGPVEPYGSYYVDDPAATVPLNDGLIYDDGYGPVGAAAYGPPAGDSYLSPPPAPFWGRLFPDGAPLWVGYVSSTYMGGTERSLWNGDIFLPLYQNGQMLWYFNMRGQADNEDAGEFNIGTGVRALARPGLVVGTYIFYDRLYSSNNNGFSQGTFGVEIMDISWDARFNVYFPESKGKSTATPPVARYSDGTIVVSGGEERAYWGFDLEGGALLGAWGPNAQHELRGFLAVYHFDHSAPGFDNITGPRARLEWRYYDLPMFGSGSRLTCGLTLQADTERGGDAFAFIGLRVPLDPGACSRPPLSRLQRRMVDPVVRDVDVVTGRQQIVEAAVNPQTGRPIGSVKFAKGDDDLAGLIAGSGDNSVIVVDGGSREIISPSAITLQPGQMVIGGGTPLAVRGANTGRAAVWNAPGSRPTIEFDPNSCPPGFVCPMVHHPSIAGFIMAEDSHLMGLDIRGGDPAVSIENVQNVWLNDIDIRHTAGGGILVNGTNRLSAEDVRIDGVPVHTWPN